MPGSFESGIFFAQKNKREGSASDRGRIRPSASQMGDGCDSEKSKTKKVSEEQLSEPSAPVKAFAFTGAEGESAGGLSPLERKNRRCGSETFFVFDFSPTPGPRALLASSFWGCERLCCQKALSHLEYVFCQ